MTQGTSAASPDSGSSSGKSSGKRGGAATARTSSRRPAAGDGAAAAKAKPYGREQVIESIIDATLELWSAKGPAEVSLRSIAARAGVNYGLVYRHFRTKEAVIRAAMDRVVARSMHFTDDCTDLVDAMDSVLPRSTGAHARLLAWAILQYFVDDILPAEDPFLQRLRDLAKSGLADDAQDADTAAKVKAGSLLAMLYGWRLFEPYLVRGLQLEQLSHEELDAHIRQRIIKALAD
jgi:TetR/AcrR family transcriptional regulator, repressor for neighboring sulfatase